MLRIISSVEWSLIGVLHFSLSSTQALFTHLNGAYAGHLLSPAHSASSLAQYPFGQVKGLS
jgi:hypothetical protein